MSGFFKELFRTQIYKRRQGRVTRQVTFAALCVGVVLGVWQFASYMQGAGEGIASLVHTEPTTVYQFTSGYEDVLKELHLQPGQESIVKVMKDAGEPVEQGQLLEEARSNMRHVEELESYGLIKPKFIGEQGKTFASVLSVLFLLVPFLIIALGIWVSFRIVNVHSFADFLIAVEAEMKKVSWPDSPTLMRSTIVVLVTIFFLAAVLSIFDLIWRFFFTYVLHVL